MNTIASAHYQTGTPQNIGFNPFKAPAEIHVTGHDRISFHNNASLGRENMFYGGEQADKILRRYQKHYADDGSSEIFHDTQTGQVSYFLNPGGDANSDLQSGRSQREVFPLQEHFTTFTGTISE